MFPQSPRSLLEPDFSAADSGWFDLSGPVGYGQPSGRADAIRLEGILANSGDLDLDERGGPTGYWGLAQDAAMRRYQKRNGLTVDGWTQPGGETLVHMRDALGWMLGSHAVPSPDDVDAHHADIARGGAGRIALAPRIATAEIAGLPDIGKAGRASNAAQIDWLTGNRSGFDGVPAQLARYVREQGDGGLAQARDFVDQFMRKRPGDSDALLAGVLRELPDPATRARFLGTDPGKLAPVGVLRTMELRREEMKARPGDISDLVYRPADDDPRANMLLAAETTQADSADGAQTPAGPQTAQATPPATGFDKPPAYRTEVFATQPGVWESVRDKVNADPALGDGQRDAYMAIFAAEGGMRRDPNGSAVAGITQGFIDGERKNGTWPAELDHVKTPADLKPEDVKPAYRHYFDQALPKIGGAGALDKIGNPAVASAIADTMFRSGPGKGATLIQNAANVATPDKIAADGMFGSRTLDAINEIAGSVERSRNFLDELADLRKDDGLKSEKPRFDHFRKR